MAHRYKIGVNLTREQHRYLKRLRLRMRSQDRPLGDIIMMGLRRLEIWLDEVEKERLRERGPDQGTTAHRPGR